MPSIFGEICGACLEVVRRFEHSILVHLRVERTHFGMPRGAKMRLALNEPK